MIYFKVLQNKTVIDAGHSFLTWNERYHDFFYCETDSAQFVQSSRNEKIYRDAWLKPFPSEATGYELAEVVVIDETEYNDVVALLDEGEPVPQEEEPEEIVPEVIPEEEEERPMTISEMRQTILNQQEQIQMLTECILELSEVIYE